MEGLRQIMLERSRVNRKHFAVLNLSNYIATAANSWKNSTALNQKKSWAQSAQSHDSQSIWADSREGWAVCEAENLHLHSALPTLLLNVNGCVLINKVHSQSKVKYQCLLGLHFLREQILKGSFSSRVCIFDIFYFGAIKGSLYWDK